MAKEKAVTDIRKLVDSKTSKSFSMGGRKEIDLLSKRGAKYFTLNVKFDNWVKAKKYDITKSSKLSKIRKNYDKAMQDMYFSLVKKWFGRMRVWAVTGGNQLMKAVVRSGFKVYGMILDMKAYASDLAAPFKESIEKASSILSEKLEEVLGPLSEYFHFAVDTTKNIFKGIYHAVGYLFIDKSPRELTDEEIKEAEENRNKAMMEWGFFWNDEEMDMVVGEDGKASADDEELGLFGDGFWQYEGILDNMAIEVAKAPAKKRKSLIDIDKILSKLKKVTRPIDKLMEGMGKWMKKMSMFMLVSVLGAATLYMANKNIKDDGETESIFDKFEKAWNNPKLLKILGGDGWLAKTGSLVATCLSKFTLGIISPETIAKAFADTSDIVKFAYTSLCDTFDKLKEFARHPIDSMKLALSNVSDRFISESRVMIRRAMDDLLDLFGFSKKQKRIDESEKTAEEWADKIATIIGPLFPGGKAAIQPAVTTGTKIAQRAGQAAKTLVLSGVQWGKEKINALYNYISAGKHVDVGGVNATAGERFFGMAEEFYRTTGQKLRVTSAFRDNAKQTALYQKDLREHGGKKSGMVAAPGKSKHEKGIAYDIDKQGAQSPQSEKLDRTGIAAKWGFYRPMWPPRPGKVNESWHWQYGGTTESTPVDKKEAKSVPPSPNKAQEAVKENASAKEEERLAELPFSLASNKPTIRYEQMKADINMISTNREPLLFPSSMAKIIS